MNRINKIPGFYCEDSYKNKWMNDFRFRRSISERDSVGEYEKNHTALHKRFVKYIYKVINVYVSVRKKNFHFTLPAKSIFILCFFSVSGFQSVFPTEENIAIKSVKVGHISINTSLELNKELSLLYNKIPGGLIYLENTFGVKVEKEHTFWFFSKEIEMITIMRRGLSIDDQKTILNSLRRRSYMDERNTVLYSGIPPVPEKIFRLLFTRISVALMEKNTPSPENRNEWFFNGLSTYTGYLAEGKMRGVSDTVNLDDSFLKYYARYADMNSSLNLESLSSSAAWKHMLSENPEKAYATASLAVLYLIRTYGFEKTVEIFQKQKEKPFDEAFREVTGDKLGSFYKKIEKKFYPEVRKISES